MKYLLSLLLLTSQLFAQTDPGYSPILVDRFGGLNDTDPSAVLQNFEAQDLLNVESSIGGNSLKKRDGFSRLGSLTVSTSPVNGSFSFTDPNGSRQDVVCHNRYCAKSTNGTTFSTFLSSAGAFICIPTRWSFVQINGILYGANDCRDPILSYNGTTLSYPLTMPLGSILELTKDRLVVADIAANPNGVYYSQSGTYTNFTTGLNSVDPYIDQIGSSGDKITGLKYALGRFYIFKTTSLTSCILGDQYTSHCYPVSNVIGTNDPLSVVEVPGAVYFRGAERHYWKLQEDSINIISKKISVFASSQTSGSAGSNTQNSQSDWQAGVQVPTGTWNTVITAGSIFPSSFTITQSSGSEWNSGTYNRIVSSAPYGQLQLMFTNLKDISNNPTWTQGSGQTGKFSNNAIAQTTNSAVFSDNTPGSTVEENFTYEYISTTSLAYGTWESTMIVQNDQTASFPKYTNADWIFLASGPDTGTVSGYSLYFKGQDHSVALRKWSNGTISTLNSDSMSAAPDGGLVPCKLTVFRSSSNVFTITGADMTGATHGHCADISFSVSDSTFTTSGNSIFQVFSHADTGSGGGADMFAKIYNMSFPYEYYVKSGTFTSTTFDTRFTTPTWGPFTVDASTGPDTFIALYTQSSADGSSFDSAVTGTLNGRITSNQKRYIKYSYSFTSPVSTKTPVIYNDQLVAVTTGMFTTQCIQPGGSITAWGILSCAETKAGAGSLVYYATSAATCATLPSVDPYQWQTSVSNNVTLPITTNAALYLGFRSLLGSTTDQTQVDACTVYWTNGSAAPPVWGAYDPIKNSIYWTAAVSNSSTTNRLVKYDLDLDQWFPFALNANAPISIRGTFYFGDSNGGYWNQYGTVSSDNGSSINAYWKSRDFGAGNPFLDKQFNRISLVAKNQITGDMTVTYTTSNNASGSYTVSLSTTSGIVYVRANSRLPLLSPYEFVNIKLGNNSATPFEISGMMLDYSVSPWKAQNP